MDREILKKENAIAEHGTESNLSKKKTWENSAINHADDNPDSSLSTVHEPQYTGDEVRPSSVNHSLLDDGKPVKGFTQNIPNPT